LQEHYDNAGLIVGDKNWDCTGIITTLDATEEVVLEAVAKNCNLIVAHHPIIFSGLKKINGKNYVEKTVIAAIKNNVAIYAIHTNLDNVLHGVNGKMAELLQLKNTTVLAPKAGLLKKLYTFVPAAYAPILRDALFAAGAGNIGNYSECSFNAGGEGTFKAGDNTTPFVGEIGQRHTEAETKIEVIFPAYLQTGLVEALKKAHPYEEVAYDIVTLDNLHQQTGSGLVGELEHPVEETVFLKLLKERFGLTVIRHTPLNNKPIRRVAICGGAGSFLIKTAIQNKADIYITADMKYHEFFDAEGRIVIADIGHFESEQFTIDLLAAILEQKFPTFAVLKTIVQTNPVRYFLG
jgi:dinuclear metal center YbgI/SA1388 family protein